MNNKDFDSSEEALTELRRSIVWMDLVLANLKEAVFVVGFDLKILFVNDALGKLLDKPRVFLLGLTPGDIFEQLGNVALSDKVKAVNREQLVTFTDLQAEYQFVSNGRKSNFEIIIQYIKQLNQVIFVLRDTTERIKNESMRTKLAVETSKRDATNKVMKLLEKSEERLRLIVDSVKDYAIFSLDMNGTVTSWNEGAERIYGYQAREVMDKNMALFLPYGKNTVQDVKKHLEIVKNHGRIDEEVWRKKKDGSLFLAHLITAVLYDGKGDSHGFSKITKDITQKREAENALLESEERYRLVVENARDLISTLSIDGKFLYVSPSYEQILGYKPTELVGQIVYNIIHPDDRSIKQGTIDNAIEAKKEFLTIMKYRHKNGHWVIIEGSCSPILNSEGKAYMLVSSSRDITERVQAEETIRYQALHDSLTELPNRKSIEERFVIAKSITDRHYGKLAILFLDLDRFKNINDTLGHYVGDMILKETAARFKSVLRESDTAARLGGDEFMLIVTDIKSSDDVIGIADKLLRVLDTPMIIEGNTLHVSTSIGIALYPNDGEDVYQLLKNADVALYRAKEGGRNRFQFYNQSMNLHSYARLALENDLRQANKKNEIIFFYQPIVNKHKKLIGIEALMRWKHPKLGLLQPNDFISLAEETGVIVPIGLEGIKQIFNQCKEWKDEFGLTSRVSLNISSRQFAEFDFITEIKKLLMHSGLSPTDIELEITESIAMNNTERTNSKLKELKEMGIAISIDDFGTGYSSLSYLKTFPITRLKIDKSFVNHCLTDKQDSSIIKAIIAVGHSLEMEVIAEGVETQEQYDYLIEQGCDGFQGYLFDKPMPLEEFKKWLAR